MSDLIKKVKIKKEDGTYTNYIPIGAEAKNVDCSDGESVEYKLNKKPYYYNSVADMKADTKLKVGDMVITLGYYEPNDGGQSVYLIKKTIDDITPAIENATYIKLNNNLFAKLIYEDELNVKQFGAYGDGIHDDTDVLNNFFDLENIRHRKVNKGTYLITDTIFVRGIWRQDRTTAHFNGLQIVDFDNSNINYQGPINGCSLFFTNFFQGKIKNLAIDRTSPKNYVDVVGCWHTVFDHFDIRDLGIKKDETIISKAKRPTLSVKSIEHLCFNNGYILGTIVQDSTGTYINQVNYTQTTIYSRNNDYCMSVINSGSNQNICFNECDLSYATKAVFYIDKYQTGGGSIKLLYCYLDSAIPQFYQNNENNMTFINIGSYQASGSSPQIDNIYTLDFLRNTTLASNARQGNLLPYMMVNTIINGNLANGLQINNAGYLLGKSSSNVTKEIVPSVNNIYGYAQKLTWRITGTLYLSTCPLPVTSTYTFAIRCKVLSEGNAHFQIGVGGYYQHYYTTAADKNKELILSFNSYGGDTLYLEEGVVKNPIFSLLDYDGDEFIMEVYEVLFIPGNMVILNTPLHPAAYLGKTPAGYVQPTFSGNINANNLSQFPVGLSVVAGGANQQGTPRSYMNYICQNSGYDNGALSFQLGVNGGQLYYRWMDSNGEWENWRKVTGEEIIPS